MVSDSEPKKETTQINSQKLYALLGEFLVKFQYLCSALKVGIMLLDDTSGDRKGRVTDILTTQMPANVLLKSFNSIALSRQGHSEFDFAVLAKVYSKVIKVIEARNELVHGSWFVYDETKFTKAKPPFRAANTKHTRKGVKDYEINLTGDYLENLILDCDDLFQVVTATWMSLIPPNSLKSTFSIDNSGDLRRHSSNKFS